MQDHFSDPNMATILDAMAPGARYNWAPLILNGHVHPRSTSCIMWLVASSVLGGELSWKVPGHAWATELDPFYLIQFS